jgi:hypothetical protein
MREGGRNCRAISSRRFNPRKGTKMSIWEILLHVAVFAVLVWWAANANFSPCDECDFECRQGRDCNKKP